MSTRKYDFPKYDLAFSVLNSNECILQILEVPSLVEEGSPEKKNGEKLEEDKAPHVGGGGGSGGGSGSDSGGCC